MKEQNTEMESGENSELVKMSPKQRWGITAFGIFALAIGVYGILKTSSTMGYTTLTMIASAAVLISIRGVWPDKIGKDGVEFPRLSKQEAAKKEFEGRFEEAPSALVRELQKDPKQFLPSAIDSVEGYSYSQFDLELQRALKYLFPYAKVSRGSVSGDVRPDFQIDFGGTSLWLETKFLTPKATQFKGVTLDFLLEGIPSNIRLLVIANVQDVDVARTKVKQKLGDNRAAVICWRGPQDNLDLFRSINLLTQ